MEIQPDRQRADQWLVSRGQVRSRAQAQELIARGDVTAWTAEGKSLEFKSSTRFTSNVRFEVSSTSPSYASRGAFKLAGALLPFRIPVTGRLCLDVGQSTGGFTEYLLEQGAQAVIGIDVGRGQLDTRLRNDHRVECLEGINIRHCSRAMIGNLAPIYAHQIIRSGFDCVVVDLSFISARKVLSVLAQMLSSNGDLVLLVKPQFEMGPGAVNKRGIVRDQHKAAQLKPAFELACVQQGLAMVDWRDSPIKGGSGNHEFLMHARRIGDSSKTCER